MSPSPLPTPGQSPPVTTQVEEEDALAMPTPNIDEVELLAHFDRFMQVDAPSPPSASMPPALDVLAARFPSFDLEVLREILAECAGDPAVASTLLAPNPAPTDSDAALAERMQRRENRRAAAATARSHRSSESSAQTRMFSESAAQLDKPALSHMVDTLRQIVVPALRAHFEELVIPNMCDSSASVEYALEDFHVSALSFPEHNIVVKAAPDARSIRVNVFNIFLGLEVGKWSYQGTGIVPVKDSGTARVSVQAMSVALRLEPHWSDSRGTKVVISDCDVTVDGVVRFKTQGAAADWAYNAIAVVLKPLVVSYIKEAVADTVTAALAVHLTQCAFTRPLVDGNRPTVSAESSTQPPATAVD